MCLTLKHCSMSILPDVKLKLKIYCVLMFFRPFLILLGHFSNIPNTVTLILVWTVNYGIELLFYYLLFKMRCISYILQHKMNVEL